MGKVVPDRAIDRETGRFPFELTNAARPRLTLEVALCQGAAALHFTAAHASIGAGLHMAVNPFRLQYFQDQGRCVIEYLGLGAWFSLLRARSDHALAVLQNASKTANIVFIDGDHRFDTVIMDYYFADKPILVNGLLIFEEGGYECPTKRVQNLVAANMANYERVDSLSRLHLFRWTSDDARTFADEWPF